MFLFYFLLIRFCFSLCYYGLDYSAMVYQSHHSSYTALDMVRIINKYVSLLIGLQCFVSAASSSCRNGKKKTKGKNVHKLGIHWITFKLWYRNSKVFTACDRFLYYILSICTTPLLYFVNLKYHHVIQKMLYLVPIVLSVRGVTPFSQLSQMLCLVSPLGLH